MPVNALGVLPNSTKLLLATPSAAGSIGNSVVTFDPGTRKIDKVAFVGSEPSILAVDPDGSAVYAYLAGEQNVARLQVASESRDLVFAADPVGGSNQYDVVDMAVGSDGGLAISYSGALALNGIIEALPIGGTIAVFDNGVPRPAVDFNDQGRFARSPAAFDLEFDESGSTLYAYNSLLTSFQLKREAISNQGVRWLSTTAGLVSGFDTTIRFADGMLYTSNGRVVDPERSLVVGRFSDSWLTGRPAAVAPDSASGRIYFITIRGILQFDIRTHALLGRLPFDLGSDHPVNLVRFGANGLAFSTATKQVYLADISAILRLPSPVPSPQPPFIADNGIVPNFSSVPSVQPGSWVSIYGANLASSTATWNGDFPTMLAGTSVTINDKPAYLWYVSPNQINLQAPDDSAVGVVNVTVTTAEGTATNTVSLSPFGPSLSLLDHQHVAAVITTHDGSGAYENGTYDLAGPIGHFGFNTRPVAPGEILSLYGVGFGPTSPTVPTGRLFSGTAPTTNSVTVTIGGEPAAVLFSGMVGAGLYQINVEVPSVPSGDQPVRAAVGGVSAPAALVAVQ